MANEIISGKYGHSISYDAGSDCGAVAGMHLTGGVPVVHGGVKYVRFETKFDAKLYGQTVQIKYEARPELAALVAEYEAIQAQLKAEREAKWAAKQAGQATIDKPLLEAMWAKVAELRAIIPADHVRVDVKQTGDLDGDPILEYTVDGVKLSWDDVNHIGTASAIRPGALGAFAAEWICSISKAKFEEIKAAQQTATDTKKAAKEARQKELAETPIPAAAVQAYNYYHGDANKAWENEDESAWALIEKWTPYIEVQHGMDIEKMKHMAAEASKEASFGINEE